MCFYKWFTFSSVRVLNVDSGVYIIIPLLIPFLAPCFNSIDHWLDCGWWLNVIVVPVSEFLHNLPVVTLQISDHRYTGLVCALTSCPMRNWEVTKRLQGISLPLGQVIFDSRFLVGIQEVSYACLNKQFQSWVLLRCCSGCRPIPRQFCKHLLVWKSVVILAFFSLFHFLKPVPSELLCPLVCYNQLVNQSSGFRYNTVNGQQERERERENSNSNFLFYKDWNLGSVKNLSNWLTL